MMGVWVSSATFQPRPCSVRSLPLETGAQVDDAVIQATEVRLSPFRYLLMSVTCFGCIKGRLSGGGQGVMGLWQDPPLIIMLSLL